MGCVNGGEHVSQTNHPYIARYIQIMRLDHPLNVNKKYEHICKIYPSETAGEGSKRTAAYDCLVTQAEFIAKRKQFWQTRTSGDQQSWAAIELALDAEDEDGLQVILESARLKTLNQSIQMCVDSRVSKFEIPIFCINMPKKFSKTSVAETRLQKNFEEKPLVVKIRSTKFVTDSVLNVDTKKTIEQLKRLFKQQVKLPESTKVRMFYRGREINDQFFIGNYGVINNDVVQAMIIM